MNAPTPEPSVDRPTPRRWPRRLRRLAIVALGLLLVLRVAVQWSLPTLLDSWAEGQGLACAYERLDLSLVTGDVELWHLELADRQDGRSLVHLEYCRLDAAMVPLLTGELVVRRAEVDGLDVNLRRDADGHWNLALGAGPQDAPEEDAAPADEVPTDAPAADAVMAKSGTEVDATPLRFDFSLPVAVDALRAQNVRLNVRDERQSPVQEFRIDTQVRVSDLASPVRPLRFEITSLSPEIIDQLAVEGTARIRDRLLEAQVQVRVRALHLEPAAPLLAGLGLRPAGGPLSFDLAATLHAEAQGERAEAMNARLEVRDVSLRELEREHFAIDRIDVDVARLDGEVLDIETVQVAGVRGHAERTREGFLSLAGLERVPVEDPATPDRDVGEPPAPTGAPSRALRLGELGLEGVSFAFTDHGTAAEPLTLAVPEIRVRELGPENRPASLLARVEAPGVFRELQVRGDLGLSTARQSLDLQFDMSGITATALEPYLSAAGMSSEFEDGRLRAHLAASVETTDDRTVASMTLDQVSLTDGEELLSLAAIHAPSVTLSRQGIDLGEVEIRGARVNAVQEPDGLHVAGLHLHFTPAEEIEAIGEVAAAVEREVVAVNTPSARAGEVGTFLAMERLWLHDHHLILVDRTTTPTSVVRLEDVAVEVGALRLRDPAFHGATPVSVSLTAPGVFESLALRGEVRLVGDVVDAHADLAIRDITGTALQPHLTEVGLGEAWQGGALDAVFAVHLEQTPERLSADAEVTGLTVRDGQRELLRWARLGLQGLEVVSDADPAVAPTVRLGELSLTGGRVALPAGPAGALPVVGLEVSVRGVDTASPDQRTPFEVLLSVPDAVEELRIEGGLQLAPASQRLDLTLRGKTLQTLRLQEWWPGGLEGTLSDGSLEASLTAALAPHADGGFVAELALGEMRWARGDDVLLGFDGARIVAPRIDPAGGIVQIREVSLAGVECAARRTEDGGIETLGLRLGGGAPEPAPADDAEAAEPAPTDGAEPGAAVATTGAPAASTAPASSSDAPAASSAPLPMVTLEDLDLELRRLTWTDEGAGAVPVDLALRLRSAQPLAFGGDDLESNAPLQLALEGSASPLLAAMRVDLTAAPFQAEPQLTVQVAATGLDLTQLTQVMPALQSQIRGADVTDGEFTLKVQAGLFVRRRDPLDFNLSEGFGLELTLEQLALRDAPGGRVLAGLDRVFADVARVDPVDGSALVHVVEIEKPIAHVVRDRKGTHLLGLILAEPPPQTAAPAEGPPAEPAPGEAPSEPAPGPVDPPAAGAGVTIERLYVTGLDVRVEDDTVEPPFVLPLSDLDVEVRNASTRALTEHQRIRYSVLLNAGDVELPGRERALPLFGEVAVRGELYLSPQPEGWTSVGVNGLELTGFQGHAAAAGVDIADGTLDLNVLFGLPGDGRMVVDSSTSLVDLDLSEPENGPISRYLHLPAPLNVIVMLLRDNAGSISVPLNLELQDNAVGVGQIATAGVTAFGRIVADAIASSPFRVLGTVGDVASLLTGAGEEEVPAELEEFVEFTPGQTLPPAARLAELEALVEQLDDDEDLAVTLVHELGAADREILDQRVNPTRQDCLVLIDSLRLRRADLLELRAELLESARIASQAELRSAAADLRERIGGLDVELGQAERALDQVALRLDRTAPSQGQRRTRQASLSLAYQRLVAIRAWLLDTLGEEQADRIRIRRPQVREASAAGGGRVVIAVTTSRSG